MKTPEELGITPRQQYNLMKHAIWLWDNRDNIAFSMMDWAEDQKGELVDISAMANAQFNNSDECGTVCCVVGHAVNPAIQLVPPLRLKGSLFVCEAGTLEEAKENYRPSSKEYLADAGAWWSVSNDLFGITEQYMDSDPWHFLFGFKHPSSVSAAVTRIFWFLDHMDARTLLPADAGLTEVHNKNYPPYKETCGKSFDRIILDPEGNWELDIEQRRKELEEFDTTIFMPADASD